LNALLLFIGICRKAAIVKMQVYFAVYRETAGTTSCQSRKRAEGSGSKS